MKKTWIELLYELPVDTTLREFLVSNGLTMPEDFAWTDRPETTKALIKAVEDLADIEARDSLGAKLRNSVALGDGAGSRAMFEAASGDPSVIAGLATCKSDAHRSFWLFCKHPAVFDRAVDVDDFERQCAGAVLYEFGLKMVSPDMSGAALAALCGEVSAFYQRELQCGDRVKAHLVQRSPGIYLLSVHVKDQSKIHLEFVGDDLKRRVGNPNIHALMEFSSATGVSRSLVKGGAKFHQMLIKAFAEHLLHMQLDAQRLMPPTLNLSILRTGFNVPQAQADGFTALQVKSLTLMSPDNQLKIDCMAMASSDNRCVTELLREKLPTPIVDNWLITAAHISLHYPRESGRTRARVVNVEVTRKGRLNLHKFDSALQAQLEGYLVSIGILNKDQTLSAREVPPTAGADVRSVVGF